MVESSRLKHVLRLAMVAILVLSGNAVADVRLVEGKVFNLQQSGNIRDFPHLLIYGRISASDLDKVQSLMPQLQSRNRPGPSFGNLVFLNSLGGDVLAAMRIGNFLRGLQAKTAVDNGDSCSSACIFVLAGGVDRMVFEGSRLGIHRPAFEQVLFAKLNAQEAAKLYTALADRARQYFRDMGIGDKLFPDMLRVPSQELRWVDTAYAEEVNLRGRDPAYEEWTRAREVEKRGAAYMRQMDLLLECMNSGNNLQLCKDRFPLP